MEREKIGRKRRGIAVLTLAALFFLVSAADSGKPADSKKNRKKRWRCMSEKKKKRTKEENEKSEEVQEQEPGSTDKNLFRYN